MIPYDSCINWDGPVNVDTGYPQTKHNGKNWRTHRLVYYFKTGDLPEVVMHLCNNKLCINPNHLKGGTQKENVAHARATGLMPPSLSTQTKADILCLLQMGYRQVDIAYLFNTKQQMVSKVKHGTA